MGIITRVQVVQFEGQTLILRKMVERKTFLAKPKPQNCVSKKGEHVYIAQSRNEWRLSRESKHIPFDRRTFILRKMVEKKAFLAKSKASILRIPMCRT